MEELPQWERSEGAAEGGTVVVQYYHNEVLGSVYMGATSVEVISDKFLIA